MRNYNAKLKQNGMMVVEINAPTIKIAEREINHYALMYGQDGEIEVIRDYKIKVKKEKKK